MDECGVCGGDGSSCNLNKYSWTESLFGKHDIMIIPRGATNIKVEQQRAGSTVISLDKNDDLNDVIKSLPSDAWRLAEAATSRISGAEFYYERSIRHSLLKLLTSSYKFIYSLQSFLSLVEYCDFNRYRRKRLKVDTLFSSFFRRVRATSMTQRRVENTRVHFWTFSPVSVKRLE